MQMIEALVQATINNLIGQFIRQNHGIYGGKTRIQL
jgi:hypothetical protein